jgi:hypothetical protein
MSLSITTLLLECLLDAAVLMRNIQFDVASSLELAEKSDLTLAGYMTRAHLSNFLVLLTLFVEVIQTIRWGVLEDNDSKKIPVHERN